jgi:hypothetical protein
MKKEFSKKIIINYFICISLFFLLITTVSAENPTIGEIKLEPANPAPESEVTISTDITGGNVSNVRLIISECNKETGVCHIPRNISMSKKSGDTYEIEIMLEWDDATSIKYQIRLENDGAWIIYDEYTSALSTPSGGSDTTGDNSNGSPGFEIIIFLIALIGVILSFKKFKTK